MSGSLVLAQENYELKVMRLGLDARTTFLGTPPPQYAFNTFMYDETTGFIIEQYNNDPNMSRVLYFDMSLGNPTANYRSDGKFLYCCLMEFIPYPQSDFSIIPLQFNLSPTAYQDVWYRWQELTEPKAHFVLDQEQWLQANAAIHALQITQQQVAYTAYVAQQSAFQATQDAAFELARRIEAELKVQQLANQLKQMSVSTYGSEYIDSESRANSSLTLQSDTQGSADYSAVSKPSDNPPILFSPLVAGSKKAQVSAKAQRSTPLTLTPQEIDTFARQLGGYPATLPTIYQILNSDYFKKNKLEKIIKFFTEITIPITVCEDLLSRNVSSKIKIALLYKMLTYSDQECIAKLQNAKKVMNVANEFKRDDPQLRQDIVDKFHLIPVKAPAAPPTTVITLPAQGDARSNVKTKSKNHRKASKQERVGELFNLLNTKNFTLEDLKGYSGLFDQLNHHNQTALMVAIQNKLDVKIIRYILDNTSPKYIIHLDPDNQSVLHYWASYLPQRVGLFDDIYTDYVQHLKENMDLKFIVDIKGETFLHVLLKQNVSPRNFYSALKVVQRESGNSIIGISAIVKDNSGNSPLTIIEERHDGWSDTRALMLNVVADAGFYILQLMQSIPDQVLEAVTDVFNLTKPDNMIHQLVEANDKKGLLNLLIDRGYLRAQLDIFTDHVMHIMFGEHDLTKKLASLMQNRTPESEEKIIWVIDLCLGLEIGYKTQKDQAISNHNLLHAVINQAANGTIQLRVAKELVQLILQRSNNKIDMIQQYDTTFCTAVDACLELINKYQENPDATQILRTLIENGADMTHVDEMGQNILHKICANFDVAVLNTFLRIADLSPSTIEALFKAKDSEEDTPTMLADRQGKMDIIEVRRQNLVKVLRLS